MAFCDSCVPDLFNSIQYPNTSGKGASLYGGRWNGKGSEAVYAAANPSLALDVVVHFSDLPAGYGLTPIDIPERLVEVVRDDRLPLGWGPTDSRTLCAWSAIT
jgi:hypothetical protein